MYYATFFIGLSVSAEKKVSSFSMSYLNNKEYDIQASEVKSGKFSYFIFADSKEENGICGVQLKSDKIQELTDCLRQIETKYKEWSETAKNNNVTDFDKSFDIALPKMDCFFKYGSKWCFDYGWKIKPYFKVTTDGDCLVVINIPQLTSAGNRFMHHLGMMFAFKSIEEIENFIKAIDPSHALSNSEETQKKEDLFK